MNVPPGGGGHGIGLPEGFGKIAHLLEAAGGGDGGNGLLGVYEQFGGFLQAVLFDVTDGCHSDDIFKAAEAFALTDKSAFCDLKDGEFKGAVLMDICQHAFHPFLFPERLGRGAALTGPGPVGMQKIQQFG